MSTSKTHTSNIQLSPSQQKAFDRAIDFTSKSPVVTLSVQGSLGRTTILRKLEIELAGKYIGLAEIFENMKDFHPLQLEEGLEKTLRQAIESHDCVIVDDFFIINSQLGGQCGDPARPSIFNFALDALFQFLVRSGKHLIIGDSSPYVGEPLESNSLVVRLPGLDITDLKYLIQCMCPFATDRLDYAKIHRFVPQLSAKQIRMAAHTMTLADVANTEAFLTFLEKHALYSNVNRAEVEKVSLEDLYGIEEVKKQLEINVVIPFERDDLVDELDLRPKRGVLLYGPPGTGKTTIGRALAHRLGSKFFLIDGTVISGTNQFYHIINGIFQKAKANAPSILFIDDCDLLFEDQKETGLYRYLLTMLDGLESKSNEQVTIMLTAMNIGSLPPALIRSGRVELWLETKLPKLEARVAIIENKLSGRVLSLNPDEILAFAELAEGLTGSDLSRVITDARNLHGYDIAKGKIPKASIHYFEGALHQLKDHREQLESAPAFTAAHRPSSHKSIY